jgi:hypothetical protein
MINETLNNSIGLDGLTYDNVVAITSSAPFFWAYILFFGLFLIIFISWGCLARARVDGRIIPKTHVIGTANYWISFILLWVLPCALFLIIFRYPIWLLLFY